ncbi:acetylserotonin O-methyltransferase [Pendulispora rubella]|uniref:Acetylserotonin O-methyltransferase n=1 Tax=Pendulispora rubella TaxID=2741070 RepID=A0ABZ2KXF6_9BACT
MQEHARRDGLAPAVVLMQLITGKWVSQAISVAAELGVADQLKDGARSSDELAAAVGANEDALYRLLRALTNVGLFQEDAARRFQLTELGQYLRRDVHGNLNGYARFLGEEHMWNAWGQLRHSVRTGEPAFDHVYGEPIFDYVAKAPDVAAVFQDAMTSISGAAGRAIAAAYDFGSVRKLVDVGGGHGFLLATILAANPRLKGVVFDVPHVVEGARQLLRAENLGDRIEVVSGDFFDAVPQGGDAYIMKHIIHDWDDARSIAILRNCHRAMVPGGKLLVVDQVVPAPNEVDFAKLMDLEMLALTPGGRERTADEFRKIFAAAGFTLTRIVPTEAYLSVVEGQAV